jgi:putative Mn2+ efflux pump MntP
MNIQHSQTYLSAGLIFSISHLVCIIAGLLLCHYVLSKKVLDFVRSYLFLVQGRTMIREATKKVSIHCTKYDR